MGIQATLAASKVPHYADYSRACYRTEEVGDQNHASVLQRRLGRLDGQVFRQVKGLHEDSSFTCRLPNFNLGPSFRRKFTSG